MSIIASMEPVGRNIKYWREKKGITQDKLAIKSGLHLTTIAKIEAGMRQGKNIETLQRIAKGLDISLNSLLNPPKERR